MTSENTLNEGGGASVPLVVDLDGTLIRTDLLVESAFAFAGSGFFRVFTLFRLLAGGKAALKEGIAAHTPVDVAVLPYDERILALIAGAKKEGRPVYIASASNERYVAAVAAHVGADGWFASDATVNLSGEKKARALVEVFGEKGFDYAGNDRADLPVWACSRRGWAVGPSGAVCRTLATRGLDVEVLPGEGGGRAWLRLIRVHQWAKNSLVLVPMVTAQMFGLLTLMQALGAFLAFSFAASAIYILNDLVDLEADRKHPTKKRRPLAAGTVPVLKAIPLAVALVAGALALACVIGPLFAAVLLVYLGLTTAYTFVLKRKMFVDVVTLATLYTLRVIAGAAAISVAPSEWLLGFSMFIFTSLALIKRYVELATRLDAGLPDPSNRNYRITDLDVVSALAAASGFNAVTVFALYVSSDAVRTVYTFPALLWLICPVLMYWIGRALILANRRLIDDDPILFAIRDRNSLFALALTGAILLVAAWPF